MTDLLDLTEQIAALEATLGGTIGMVSAFDGELAKMQSSLVFTGQEVGALASGFSGGLRRAFDGVVFDEYGLQPGNIFSEVVRPGLSDRQGWALFLGTPNGKNQFYDMAQRAQTDDTGTWAYLCFKASETGIIASEELADARTMMTEDEYAQEYECSWEAAVKGSIYGKEMDAAQQEGRIGVVPVDPVLPVFAFIAGKGGRPRC